MTFRILAIGEILWDLLPSGRQMGGDPANFACHAKLLGADTRLITRVGNDALGQEILRRLTELGIPTDTVSIDPAAPTGTVSVDLLPGGLHRFTIHQNVAWDNLTVETAGLAAVRQADAVCFGTLGQRSAVARRSCQTHLSATRLDALRIFDINLRQDFYSRDVIEHSLATANVMKVNDEELPVLAAMLGLSGSTPDLLAQLAARFDLRLVALTRGSKGSLLYAQGEFSEHPGIKVEVRDTIGAGDAFTAAMTVGLLSGWKLDEINRQAVTVAAEVCSYAGVSAAGALAIGGNMELWKVVALWGPNVWAPCPMLEVWVELEEPSGGLSANAPHFQHRLAAWMALISDPLDRVEADAARLETYAGLSLVELLPSLTLRLQRAASGRASLRRGFTRETGKPGHYRVAVEFEEESLARLALTSARKMCLAAAGQGEYDAAAELGLLRAFADRYCLGPSTLCIVEAAHQRRIPTRRLNDRSLVQLGHGIHRRRIFTAETDRTSTIAEGIAQDKELTKTLLRAVGVPVPEGRIVTDANDAWLAAREIGLPVVVKPRDANHGRGVSLNLSMRHQIEAAYALAVIEGNGVMVEGWARGAEHRLLVVADQLVAVSRGEPEQVVGDGQHTVAELVELLNRDPRRGLEFAFPLGKVELDPSGLLTLEQQGYRPDSVPGAGATVMIHANGDFTTDETDEVHPDVAAQAVLAAQVIGLDVAGIDVIATTLVRPLREQGGVVIEVNAGPGLRMHLEPQRGRPRAVGEVIVQSMFPAGNSGRIPTVAVCGEGSGITTGLVSRLLRAAGYYVGTASQDDVYVNERRLESVAGTRPQRQRAILLHPLLSAAVFESSAATMIEGGLAFDQCDVAIVVAPGEAPAKRGPSEPVLAAAEDQIDPGVLAKVVAGTVSNDGFMVLWADDPLAEPAAVASRGGTIWLSLDSSHPRLVEARSRGGRAAFIRENALWLATGEQRVATCRRPVGARTAERGNRHRLAAAPRGDGRRLGFGARGASISRHIGDIFGRNGPAGRRAFQSMTYNCGGLVRNPRPSTGNVLLVLASSNLDNCWPPTKLTKVMTCACLMWLQAILARCFQPWGGS